MNTESNATSFSLPIPGVGQTNFTAKEIQKAPPPASSGSAAEAASHVYASVNQSGILKVAVPVEHSTAPKIVTIDSSTIHVTSPQPNSEQMVEGIKQHLHHLAEKTELLGNIIPCQDPPEPNTPIPPEWYQIEPTAMPPKNDADVNAVVGLITSGHGLVQDGQSPIFLEGQRFPNACLHAYIEDKITLTQIVSSIMLFSALREFGIDAANASKVHRIELQGAPNEQFPVAPGAVGEERCYYRIEIPNYDNVKEGTTQFFSSDDFIPSQFVMKKNKTGDDSYSYSIAIPSYSSMQTYLNNRYGKDAVKFVPRWGNSSMHEIYQQAGTKTRVFGLDPEGKSKPDGTNYGPYGVLLHDFYHANLISNIPVSHQLAYKNMALALLGEARDIEIRNWEVEQAREAAKTPPEQNNKNYTPLDPSVTDAILKKQIGTALEDVVRQTAWDVLDMDIGWYQKLGAPKDLRKALDMIDMAARSFEQRARYSAKDYPWYFKEVLQNKSDRIIQMKGRQAQLDLMDFDDQSLKGRK